MKIKNDNSNCCNASTRTEGTCTKYYVCNKCNKACDVTKGLKCKTCDAIIPDLVASYEDNYCSEECYKELADKPEQDIMVEFDRIALDSDGTIHMGGSRITKLKAFIKDNYIAREEVEKLKQEYATSNNGREPYDTHGVIHACKILLKK